MDKSGWCIVAYIGSTPMYYVGRYELDPADNKVKPVLSIDFNKALCISTKENADQILGEMWLDGRWKVEEHSGFTMGNAPSSDGQLETVVIPHVVPCCGYKADPDRYPVYYNKFNKVVQCHNCGNVWIPEKCRAV